MARRRLDELGARGVASQVPSGLVSGDNLCLNPPDPDAVPRRPQTNAAAGPVVTDFASRPIPTIDQRYPAGLLKGMGPIHRAIVCSTLCHSVFLWAFWILTDIFLAPLMTRLPLLDSTAD